MGRVGYVGGLYDVSTNESEIWEVLGMPNNYRTGSACD